MAVGHKKLRLVQTKFLRSLPVLIFSVTRMKVLHFARWVPRAIADDFMNTEPANDSLPGEHGKPPYPGYSLGEYHSVVRMTRIPHRSMERTRTGRMKHHSAVAFDHLRPAFMRVDML